MKELSKEQKDIIEAIKDSSVVINAVAGSGKTTTILEMCKAYPEKDFLVLTYNRRLADDGNEKIEKQGIKNCRLGTIHSLARSFFNRHCENDYGLYKIIKEDVEVNNKSVNKVYDYIIIDEAQDLKLIFFQVILKLVKFFYEKNENLKLIICGDQKQTIYKHNGSSEFVVTITEEILKDFNWKRLGLKKSFRCPKNVCKFVNDYIFKNDHILNNGAEGIVRYKIADLISLGKYSVDKIAHSIDKDIKEVGLKNFMILTTIRRTGPNNIVKRLANTLSKNYGYCIWYPDEDKDVMVNKEELKDKIIFNTIHQTKGLERDIIYLFNFDNFYKKNSLKEGESFEKWKEKIENLLYVACTRAKKKLVIFDHYENKPIEILLTPPNPLTVDEADHELAPCLKNEIKQIWSEEENSNKNTRDLFSVANEIKKWDNYLISKFIEENFDVLMTM